MEVGNTRGHKVRRIEGDSLPRSASSCFFPVHARPARSAVLKAEPTGTAGTEVSPRHAPAIRIPHHTLRNDTQIAAFESSPSGFVTCPGHLEIREASPPALPAFLTLPRYTDLSRAVQPIVLLTRRAISEGVAGVPAQIPDAACPATAVHASRVERESTHLRPSQGNPRGRPSKACVGATLGSEGGDYPLPTTGCWN